MVFPQNKNLLCIYCSKMQKNTYFEWIFNQNFKILNGLKFNWFVSIWFTTKKIDYKISPITLVLKYIYNFSYSMTHSFWHKYTSYVQVHKCLLEFL